MAPVAFKKNKIALLVTGIAGLLTLGGCATDGYGYGGVDVGYPGYAYNDGYYDGYYGPAGYYGGGYDNRYTKYYCLYNSTKISRHRYISFENLFFLIDIWCEQVYKLRNKK